MASKILLVPDVFGWAWSHMADGIRKHAPSQYDVKVMELSKFVWNVQKWSRHQNQHGADWMRLWDAVLHFSWTSMAPHAFIRRNVALLASDGAMEERGSDWLHWRRVAATVVRNAKNARKRLAEVTAVIAVNKQLAAFASEINQNTFYLPAGVDHEHFAPRPFPNQEKLVVGWCGQQKPDDRGPKGWYEVLEPLRKMDLPVEWLVNTRDHTDPIPFAEMPEWYSRCDVLLSTSIIEGMQMPPLEAMACGRTVVATIAGAMSETITHGHDGFLAGAFSDEQSANAVICAMAGTLRTLAKDRDHVRRMGANARRTVEERFTWQLLAPKWLKAISGM